MQSALHHQNPQHHHHPGLGHSLSVSVSKSSSGDNQQLLNPHHHLHIGSGVHKKLDRSMSEPAEKSALTSAAQALVNNASRVNQTNSSRYKTELCRPFEENGTCKYGDKCQFAHGMHELRNLQRHPKYKTELCRTFHTTGFCPYGPRCHFIHNSEETKNSVISTLQAGFGPSSGMESSPSSPQNNNNRLNGSLDRLALNGNNSSILSTSNQSGSNMNSATGSNHHHHSNHQQLRLNQQQQHPVVSRAGIKVCSVANDSLSSALKSVKINGLPNHQHLNGSVQANGSNPAPSASSIPRQKSMSVGSFSLGSSREESPSSSSSESPTTSMECFFASTDFDPFSYFQVSPNHSVAAGSAVVDNPGSGSSKLSGSGSASSAFSISPDFAALLSSFTLTDEADGERKSERVTEWLRGGVGIGTAASE